MIRKFVGIAASLTLAFMLVGCGPADGEYRLRILTTNDLHGRLFDSTYVDGNIRNSLCAVKWYVDSVRGAAGADNVILLDDGDFLQGDNSVYYYNYVDTLTPHIFPRMAAYMGYDVVVGGNHDIETGHPVYDRVASDLEAAGIPFLAGNAIRNSDGKPYFPYYTILRRAGLKVAVLGYDNANIAAWLNESLWSGMTFKSLIPLVQENVDEVIAREKPQVVVVAVHSGTGRGDGTVLESQGLDLFDSLEGVDVLVCAHDHAPLVLTRDGRALVNSGSHARNLGYAEVRVSVSSGKVVSKSAEASLIKVDQRRADSAMVEEFHKDYEAVKTFTLREVGELKADLRTREAFSGMCPYMNLIHTISLQSTGARVSFAAPLSFDSRVKAGTLVYNDLFTIYPYENQIYLMSLSGAEILRYLEYSYDLWIQSPEGGHVLKIRDRPDPRTGTVRWSFVERSYNFDSAAGLNYTVDVTRPLGQRVRVSGFADGSAFDEAAMYTVAMTSYRASGGGGHLPQGVGLTPEEIERRTLDKFPEIRNLLYGYLQSEGCIDPAMIGDPSVIGSWSFVPEKKVKPLMEKDMRLLFAGR